jgi:hypothetical protein
MTAIAPPNEPKKESYYEKLYANQPSNFLIRSQLQLENLKFNRIKNEANDWQELLLSSVFQLPFTSRTSKNIEPGSEWENYTGAIDKWFARISEVSQSVSNVKFAAPWPTQVDAIQKAVTSIANELYLIAPNFEHLFQGSGEKFPLLLFSFNGRLESIFPAPAEGKYEADKDGHTHVFKHNFGINQIMINKITRQFDDNVLRLGIDLNYLINQSTR